MRNFLKSNISAIIVGVICLSSTAFALNAGYALMDSNGDVIDGSGQVISPSSYGEMYIADSGDSITVNSSTEWHAVTTPLTGYTEDFTFEAGSSGVIASIATDAGGILVTDVDHGLSAGDIITINGCATGGNEAYNDIFEVLTVPLTSTFTVSATYAATDTGMWQKGASLTATVAGKYAGRWAASGISETNAHVFDFAPALNTTVATKAKARRKFSNADYGSFSGTAIMDVSVGDNISFNLQNVGASGNVTIRTLDLNLNRL